jgi:GH15 family glucan-1,4-alpha-glucosidase
MARPIVLGNGELQVGLNNYGLVHDFYYPYVGLENHAAGAKLRHKIGVWIEGELSWLDDDHDWTFQFKYPHTALIGHTTAKNDRLGLVIEFDDCVDANISVFLRNIHVINNFNVPREIRLFMHQAFIIGDSRSNTDTAQYLPDSDAILHYRGRRAFVISGLYEDKPFDQHSIGLFGIEDHEGTFRDADDGELSGSNVEHGRVDSTIRFCLDIPAHSSKRVHYWVAAGMSTREALYISKQIKDDGLLAHLHDTANWWNEWLKPAIEIAKKLPTNNQEMFVDSAMIIKSQIDKHGAVIASTDTSMLNYSRDSYAYAWPRDGAFVMWPLIRMGYKDEPYRFFEFSKRGLHPSGYLMHKYRADGALGSSWHPYVHDDIVAPPIQEDETALVLFVFAQYYALHTEASLLNDFYQQMVVPMADFLASYIDETTGLPKPSYDLWEQTFLTSTYTTSVVYAGLLAASDIASAANDDANAVKWRSSANDIQEAAAKYLYNDERKVFYRGLIVHKGEIQKDSTLDSSAVFGAYMFGLFDQNSSEIVSSIETLKSTFSITSSKTGVPRYENDDYRRPDATVTGNWWFITTLWLAQYYIDQGKVSEAQDIVDWLQTLALSTGMLPEQIDPKTLEPISPAPLTWSHAEYLSTMLDMLSRKA